MRNLKDIKGFMIYFKCIEQLDVFTDEEVGKVFKGLVSYFKDGVVPVFNDRGLDLLYNSIKRDAEETITNAINKAQKISDSMKGNKNAQKDEPSINVKSVEDELKEYLSTCEMSNLPYEKFKTLGHFNRMMEIAGGDEEIVKRIFNSRV